MAQKLITTSSWVEIPYVAVEIGNYTFGVYNKKKTNVVSNGRYGTAVSVMYPNYVTSLVVGKTNGTLNTYTFVMTYAITENDDPNMIDQIISTVSSSRRIRFTYGDSANPSFLYKEEEALITGIKVTPDFASNKLTYTISATSTALDAKANSYTFPARKNTKPSSVIKEMLKSSKYGITDVFYGMKNSALVEQYGLIPGDDRAVDIELKSCDLISYLEYLTSIMVSNADDTKLKLGYNYVITFMDELTGILDGPYFKITPVIATASQNSSIEYYTYDIGYMNKDMILSFSINDDESHAILYNYSEDVTINQYKYFINNSGDIEQVYSPPVSNRGIMNATHTEDATWWSQVTQYPVSATLTVKGLLRAANLMTYVKLNIYFFGKLYNYSGLYIITKQEDRIDSNGYQTTLSLTRIAGDENAVTR